ncbi:uncharacterized protein [Battus philenor]|uniref:uncharacterized protein n=1 Tax=Battus philenor TaxID=42288 RepID=UPI0035CF4291
MPIDYYRFEGSPPCNIVDLVIEKLGIESDLNVHHLGWLSEDYLKPEFLKINPQHVCPTIVDEGFTLWESRAIAKYLLTKYGDQKLYPKDIRTRALIDQRLDFDLGTLFCRFTDYYYEYPHGKPLEEGKLNKLKEALGFLNSFLEGLKYAAGDELSLADLSLAVSVSYIVAIGVSIDEYPNVVRWHQLLKSTFKPYETIIRHNINEFFIVVNKVISLNQNKAMFVHFLRLLLNESANYLKVMKSELGWPNERLNNKSDKVPIDFYRMEGSPPCTVLSLVIAELGIQSDFKERTFDWHSQEYLNPEFKKINPQHIVPTIVENGLVLCESRAITKYLLAKYGDEKLYPKDILKRVIVDMRLDFDLGTLFCRFADYYYGFPYGQPLEEDKLKRLQEALWFLDTFLVSNKYVAGDELTLADLSLGVTVSFILAIKVSIDEYPNVLRWHNMLRSTNSNFKSIVDHSIHQFITTTGEMIVMYSKANQQKE